MKDDTYGCGENPPYALYQDEEGKWGLIDDNGNRLQAVFERLDENRFSCVPWEVVSFNSNEGFEIIAWYDPSEVWFSFTFRNPVYPAEFGGYLWMRSQNTLEHYQHLLYSHLDVETHWLAEALIKSDSSSWNDPAANYDLWLRALLSSQPKIRDYALTTKFMEPLIRENGMNHDFCCALWQAKVSLDRDLLELGGV